MDLSDLLEKEGFAKDAGYTLHQRNPTMDRHPLDKGGKMKGYIAFYKGKQMEVKAISALSARDIAAEKFRARKPYDVEVVLAEKGGKQVTHMPMFASELAKTAARPRPEFTVQGYKGFTDQIRDLDVLHTEAMELKAEIDSAVAPLLERKGKLDKEMKKIHETIKADYKDSLDSIGKITIERKTQLVEAQAELSVVARKGTLNQVNAELLEAVVAAYGDEVAAFIQTTQSALQDSNKTMAISFKGFEIERKADVKAASEKSAGLADLLSKFQDYLRKSWKRVVAVAKNALGMVESASDKVDKAHGNLEKALAKIDEYADSEEWDPDIDDHPDRYPRYASDRSTLIRMASELPKGSAERKAILAGLKTAKINTKQALDRDGRSEFWVDGLAGLTLLWSVRVRARDEREAEKEAETLVWSGTPTVEWTDGRGRPLKPGAVPTKDQLNMMNFDVSR